eukprot:gene3445-7784_t
MAAEMQVFRSQVVWWNDVKGIGFIKGKDGGRDIFLHHSNVKAGEKREVLKVGIRVGYQLGLSRGGKPPQAVEVFVIEEPIDLRKRSVSTFQSTREGNYQRRGLFGKVTEFDHKGNAFIVDGAKNVYWCPNDIVEELDEDAGRDITCGQPVTFDAISGLKGAPDTVTYCRLSGPHPQQDRANKRTADWVAEQSHQGAVAERHDDARSEVSIYTHPSNRDMSRRKPFSSDSRPAPAFASGKSRRINAAAALAVMDALEARTQENASDGSDYQASHAGAAAGRHRACRRRARRRADARRRRRGRGSARTGVPERHRKRDAAAGAPDRSPGSQRTEGAPVVAVRPAETAGWGGRAA